MPSSEDIHRYLAGSWQLMTGRPDGLRQLDLTIDGFWNSFFAIIVALPAMLAGWVVLANGDGFAAQTAAERFAIVLRLGIVDLVAWVGPLLLLGLLAKPTGIADRYLHFVIASNWASVIAAWMLVPLSVLGMFYRGRGPVIDTLSFAMFILILVLMWRLTNASLGKGAGVASAVFGFTLVSSMVLIVMLQSLLGLDALVTPG